MLLNKHLQVEIVTPWQHWQSIRHLHVSCFREQQHRARQSASTVVLQALEAHSR
jgi:hypothetical protein